MSKFRKLMAIAALLFASSSVFVACSDDDTTTMGPVPVNSVRATGTSVTVIWSIVPNEKCDGYEVTLMQGSRDGAVIGTQTLDNRTCKATFTGLTPGTEYVVKTQAVPGKGFSASEPYYREFTTAPIVTPVVSSLDFYKLNEYDDKGQPVVNDYYKATLTWPAEDVNNCGGYSVTLYGCTKAELDKATADDPAPVAGTANLTKNTANTVTFDKLKPSTNFTIQIRTTPNAMCDYTNGDWNYVEFSTPAAPAAAN
ncbi:MAG: fibronectin type III domain-containing protein [Muribaculaceae bacterium]|nr:fibronectin type III domain-containing protein [Muribaculaceae bacterium]